MSLYTDLRATAGRLLTSYGQSMTLTKRASGAYDPSTGASTVTSTTYTVKGAVFDYSGGAYKPAPMLIQAGDRRALISAEGLSVAPEPADHLTIGSTRWAIVTVTPTDPGGTAVVYECQVRRG